MQRAEIWWALLGNQEGHRPVAIVTREQAIARRDVITVAMVTSRVRGLPVEVYLDAHDGMSRPCVINCDVLRTVPKNLLQKRITKLSVIKETLLNRSLKIALGLNHE